MHGLSEGIRMPQDIALAGYYGLPFLDALPVSLTTIETPCYEIGKQAGKFLSTPNTDTSENRTRVIDLGLSLIVG